MKIKDKYLVVSLESIFQSIKKSLFICPECNNIFLHSSKKERIYCSNKCASRPIMRRKRRERIYYNFTRSDLIDAARTLKEFCKSFECDHNPCPFVQLGICGFTTRPPKLWKFICLLEEEQRIKSPGTGPKPSS